MKTLKTLLLMSLIYISGAALAGDGKTKKAESTTENAEVTYKIKNLLSSHYTSNYSIEGEYVIIYNVDTNNRICVSDVHGSDSEMKKDIMNYLNGKKIPGAPSHEARALKVNFHVHNSKFINSYLF